MANVQTGQIFDAADCSADATSDVVILGERKDIGFQFESPSGTREGAIYIQGRVDQATNFVNLSFYLAGALVTSIPVTAGAALSAIGRLIDLPYQEIRAKFVDSTGGTGVGTLDGFAEVRGARF